MQAGEQAPPLWVEKGQPAHGPAPLGPRTDITLGGAGPAQWVWSGAGHDAAGRAGLLARCGCAPWVRF